MRVHGLSLKGKGSLAVSLTLMLVMLSLGGCGKQKGFQEQTKDGNYKEKSTGEKGVGKLFLTSLDGDVVSRSLAAHYHGAGTLSI
jgi:major membrane immunogen (membrane-anchored lipoprotein)